MTVSFPGATGGDSVTKKNYMDFLKPAAMANAANIFKRLQANYGTTAVDAISIVSDVSSQILSTKGSELETLWEKIEARLNRGKAIKTTAETPYGKLNTAIGLIYSAMEVADTENNIDYVRGINSIYLSVKNHVENRFLGRTQGMEKRSLERTLGTVDSYFGRVIKRFNELVKTKQIQGPEIPV